METTLKGQPAITRVGIQGTTQLKTGTSGNSAFLDDEFGRTRLRGDLAGDVIDGQKIRVTVFFRGRAYANEDGVAGANRFTGVSGVEIFPDLLRDSRTSARRC